MKRLSLALAIAAAVAAAGTLAALPEPAPADDGASVESLAEGNPVPAAAPAAPEVEAIPAKPDPAPTFDPARLRSPFEGKLALARNHFEQREWADAFRLFTEGDDGSPQVAFLRGLAALELGRNAEAAQILGQLSERLPALADRIHFQLGLALQRMGDREGAARAFGAVPDGSVRKDEARLGEARMLSELGRTAQALEALAPLLDRKPPAWGTDHAATALDLAATLHEKRGERTAAGNAWLRLWSDHALAPEAKGADLRARQMGVTPTLAQRVRRALVHLDAHRNGDAAEQLEPLLPKLQLPDPLACEARFGLGRAYRKMREHRKAIPILEQVAARCEDRGLRARSLYVLGQSTSIVAPEQAIEVYRTLATDFPEHSFADDALVFQAELHERAGRLDRARESLVQLVEQYRDGDYRADALFRLYWLDRKEGQEERGLGWLQTLERDYAGRPDSTPVERSLYWQGRTLASLGRTVEAGAAWESLVRLHPAGYYAMLARGRLAKLDSSLAEAHPPVAADEPAPLSLRAGPLEDDPRFEAAIELIRIGFHRAAAEELLRIDRQKARERAGSDEPVLLIAWLLDQAEARRAAHHIARTELLHLLRGTPAGEAAAHYRIAYPLAYRELIERHATAYDVPADLMQALMREESSLDPQVVSWAGAVGLTQLMPSTARAVAKKLKLASPSLAQLRDPDLNVRLGTAYLGELLARWKGNPALAAASYNAGPSAVSRWLRDRGHLEMDEFVEEIPIEETRNYVKRVLGSFTTYRLTYGRGEERFVALAPTRANGTVLQ